MFRDVTALGSKDAWEGVTFKAFRKQDIQKSLSEDTVKVRTRLVSIKGHAWLGLCLCAPSIPIQSCREKKKSAMCCFSLSDIGDGFVIRCGF